LEVEDAVLDAYLELEEAPAETPPWREIDPELEDAVLYAYWELQQDLERKGRIPAVPHTVLERAEPALAILGAVQLGLLCAAFSTFATFLVANLIFHVQP
jgi:hypothetical protein